ncbi:hypothetical protein Q0N12_08335 [Rossellomorea marisflavi]|nr:hypothetical protein [Rossellomorea marisflavi]MDW4525086.1 hypothetical protein [Rossellomorea marisflavi]UTE72489.1 hypothetical protein M1I95_19845 [Rossellomorea marisflavi]WJV18457.1 hypothetical protein QU593_20395 [Rossellomorea marisflavi]VXB54092.1 conserved hypothetical protein [Bacillus sp. 349Y]
MMNITKWGYTRFRSIKAEFDLFPHSLVILRKIRSYYFVYNVRWSPLDPVVETHHLEEMERLVNREMDLEDQYLKRRSEY